MTKKIRTKINFAGLVTLSLLAAGGVVGQDTGPGVANETVCDSVLASYVCTAWTARYDGSSSGNDVPHAIAIDPAGERVFVGGRTATTSSSADYAVVAYDAHTGLELWENVWGPGLGLNIVYAMATSPDGKQVYATGMSRTDAGDGQRHYDTIAYDASDGTELWIANYDGPGDGDDIAWAIAAAPDGSKVFVTGESFGLGTGNDYATLAYDAADGNELWMDRYNGPVGGEDMAHDLALSPDGETVFVTGRSHGTASSVDYVTIAYDAESGGRNWIARYDGPDSGVDIANAIVASPDGDHVYVSGHSAAGGNGDIATVKYHSDDGTLAWESRYDGGGNEWEVGADLVITPDGNRLFATGYGTGTETGKDMLTVAIEATDGTTLWASRFDGHEGPDEARGIAVSPDGDRAFVVGESWAEGSGLADAVTVSYNADDGSEQWAARSSEITSLSQLTGDIGLDRARAVVVHPDGSLVYVASTSRSDGDLSGYNFRTLAYGTVNAPNVLEGLPDLTPPPYP